MGVDTYQVPVEAQGGDNVPLMAEPAQQQALFEAMVKTRGVLSLACDALGHSRLAVYRHKLRDPAFSAWLQNAQVVARRLHAEEQLAKVRGHIDSHLDEGWEFQRDEDGNYVLDDDFERIKVRSNISIRALVDLAKESRHAIDGEAPAVQVNNVAQAMVHAAPTAPRVVPQTASVLDDDILDAEIIEDDQEGA